MAVRTFVIRNPLSLSQIAKVSLVSLSGVRSGPARPDLATSDPARPDPAPRDPARTAPGRAAGRAGRPGLPTKASGGVPPSPAPRGWQAQALSGRPLPRRPAEPR